MSDAHTILLPIDLFVLLLFVAFGAGVAVERAGRLLLARRRERERVASPELAIGELRVLHYGLRVTEQATAKAAFLVGEWVLRVHTPSEDGCTGLVVITSPWTVRTWPPPGAMLWARTKDVLENSRRAPIPALAAELEDLARDTDTTTRGGR